MNNEKRLVEQLRALRMGRMPEEQFADFIIEAGEAGFREAEPDIVRCLSHPNHWLRYHSVRTLERHWKERAYASMFERMLEEGPDGYVRIAAAGALGSLFDGTGDRRVARLLARRVMNGQEDRFVREAAYEALLDVVLQPAQRDREFQKSLATTSEREWAARPEIDALLDRGENPEEVLARLDSEWERTLDWDLITKAATSEDAEG